MPSQKDPSDSEFAFLGRGILRTAKRDVFSVGVGVAIGAGFAVLFGLSIKLGMLCGACIGLFLRSIFSPLFDYDDPPSKGG